ncbi:hypothetical protein H310_06675 [Aphanomyces invadans]|uniref:EF-hand domain-containing protein n=1 Tax=Aphanomyces invadans TaxID=157072 RepID=A0A024U471_9STRA|nr:hypothetical protein H310_06675 [Aphanomyces invadans]ETW01044.1 hypothetical protein H310_06675 [Aphanomyces invadans]|eukprot:XP_008870042.1 hypothetical protein H310_06675 [Aphanomyces invadans]
MATKRLVVVRGSRRNDLPPTRSTGMPHTRKRRYVGNANAKRRQEIEVPHNTLPRRFHDMNFLPSPTKPLEVGGGDDAADPSSHTSTGLDLTAQQQQRHHPTPPSIVKPKDRLITNIQAHQRETKNYKLETWYKSPAGAGTVANTIAAALSAHDKNQSGFISTDDVIATLQQMNFGLKDHEVRELLLHHDSTASSLSSKGGVVHYRSFAKQFDVARDPEQDKIEDPLTRQARYIAGLQQRVAAASQVPVPSAVGRRRQHHRKNDINTAKLDTLDSPLPPVSSPATHDITTESPQLPPVHQRVSTAVVPSTKAADHDRRSDRPHDLEAFCVEGLETSLRTNLPSPTRYSAKLAPGVVPHTASTLVLGGDMRNTPKSLKRAKLMPQVVDQAHREATRQAKRHIITEHLERINAYAANADYKVKVMAENHIKATATNMLHYHQSFFVSQSQLADKNHEKGLIHSDIAKHHHNVSNESMFAPG